MRKPIISNIVERRNLKDIQKRTLEILSNAVSQSFGPFGSSTTIAKSLGDDVVTSFSKDGRTILKNIIFQDVIELSVKNNIESICRYIDINNGDGTTSAVILSRYIFDLITKDMEDNTYIKSITPRDISTLLLEVISEMKNIIKANTQEFNAEKARDIAYISTNANKEIADMVYQLYKEYGNDVFINVTISPDTNTYVKSYDGLTLETGYADVGFINTSKATCEIQNPKIYCFEDPIDTPTMAGLFDAIISNNIFTKIANKENPVPTIIFAPKINRDQSQFMNSIVSNFYQYKNPANKPPLSIITNIYETEKYMDIVQLSGATTIKKYIDPKMAEMDKKRNLYPEPNNIDNFAGSADMVISDAKNTTIINPRDMFDKDGNYSIKYENLLSYLNDELSKLDEYIDRGTDKFDLKKRINSLKGSMIELHVGGVDIIDRDNKKDLIEDAIKNCRSASKYGVGRASNFEGLNAIFKLRDKYDNTDTIPEDYLANAKSEIVENIYWAYILLLNDLYTNSRLIFSYEGINEVENLLRSSVYKNKLPYDVVTSKFSDKLICSIMTDIDMLEAVGKIISLLITTNQYLVPDIAFNRYNYELDDIEDLEEDDLYLTEDDNGDRFYNLDIDQDFLDRVFSFEKYYKEENEKGINKTENISDEEIKKRKDLIDNIYKIESQISKLDYPTLFKTDITKMDFLTTLELVNRKNILNEYLGYIQKHELGDMKL